MLQRWFIVCSFFLSLTAYGHFDSEERSVGLFSIKYKGGYLIGRLGNEPINHNKVTHILVAGSAKTKESNQFFQSALSRGYKYMELFPDHQVVMISSPEVKKKKNEEVFAEFNLDVQKNVKKVVLGGGTLIREMRKFSKIASFDFYGHSSPWGLIIGKRHATLGPGTGSDTIKSLRGHFTPLASASLNGCNGGLKIAPALSLGWQIPVSGALSGSLFERVTADGLWYNEFVSGSAPWTTSNSISYNAESSCRNGSCWRMKPSSSAYSGYWGKFGYGLGFYKFFCNYDNADKKCEQASALSLLSFPSVRPVNLQSSVEDFKEVVYDYLCPTGRGTERYYSCIQGIKNAIKTGNHKFQPFKAKPVFCTMKECDLKLVCKQRSSGPKPGSCSLVAERSGESTTFIDEYLMLLKGFKALK